MNGLLQKEVKRLSREENDPKIFNIDKFISSIDPAIWQWIVTTTQSVRESHSITLSSKTPLAVHTKKVRQLFILCLLFYSVNPLCCTPIHILLAEAVEVCNGSRKLLNILNRLGVTCSEDTHDRFVTMKAELQKKMHVWDSMDSHVFTLATVDNFDMLQSHSAVYCGDQGRSYHGTTIQIVQPNPMLQLNPPANEATCTNLDPTSQTLNIEIQPIQNEARDVQQLRQKRDISDSPANSPHKLGKVGPVRRRTMEITPTA